MFAVCESHNAQRYRQTLRWMNGQTDMMMPTANYSV